jgi:hypothetical protein
MKTSCAVYLLVAVFCGLCTGCELATLTAENVCFECSYQTDEIWEYWRDRRLAGEAWKTHAQAFPNLCNRYESAEYERGFKDGFADYLYDGRTYRPALPHRYLAARYETPEGQRLIEDWYAGYHFGVTAAQASGYRQFVVLPPQATQPRPFPPAPAYSGIAGWPVPPPAPPGLMVPPLASIPAQQPRPVEVPVLPPPRIVEPEPTAKPGASLPVAPVSPPESAPDETIWRPATGIDSVTSADPADQAGLP